MSPVHFFFARAGGFALFDALAETRFATLGRFAYRDERLDFIGIANPPFNNRKFFLLLRGLYRVHRWHPKSHE